MKCQLNMMTFKVLILYSFSILFINAENVSSRVVKISQGPVVGYKNGDLYSFYGIPYATAPTGKDRFKGPLPPPTWKEPFEAVNNNIVCPQPLSKTQEDCLIVNVFIPNTNVTNLPVLVVTHGGGYTMGFASMVTYKHLINTKNMIVITYNYRLAAHGFLCLGTEDVPGNAGIKDQLALLRWVKHNIAAFGGNPDDVTVLGFSAGSSATDLLTISNTTEGLFNKVILDSGANVAFWSVQMDPIEHAKKYAKMLNFTNVDNLKELEEFYKTISYDELISQNSTGLFSPCIERDVGQEMFLCDSPVNILKSGNYHKVPMLYGFSNMEGILQMDHYNLFKNEMNKNFNSFMPTDLHFKNDEEKQLVVAKVKSFYFGNNDVNDNNILQFIDYFSDTLFVYPISRSIKLNLEAGNKDIYLYEYSFVDNNTALVPYTNVKGATHCSETVSVADGTSFAQPDESSISKDYMEMKTIMRKLVSNFIVTGKPVSDNDKQLPAWPTVGNNWSPHMEINLPIKLKGSLLLERLQFWDDLYEKYYKQPIPPTTA